MKDEHFCRQEILKNLKSNVHIKYLYQLITTNIYNINVFMSHTCRNAKKKLNLEAFPEGTAFDFVRRKENVGSM